MACGMENLVNKLSIVVLVAALDIKRPRRSAVDVAVAPAGAH